MTPWTTFNDQGRAFVDALEAAGIAAYWLDGVFQVSDLPAAQALLASFDPLPLAKAAKREQVNAIKLEREIAGCVTPLGRVDTDQKSRDFVAGAVQMALLAKMANAPFLINWTMEDDTDVAHNADQMIALGQAVGAFHATVHGYARYLKGQIEAATSLAELDAINIQTGWPA